jgi:NAD(P)-dependent dehydrogenase (short-subunit alcohol dehydrogenase family)
MTTPDLSGKVVVVTGGNSGIGKQAALELAGMGANVVIAARNPQKAGAAVKEIQAATGAGSRVETIPIDLASFASVRAFADAFTASHERLDVLLNNAGLVLRKREVTEDGHEMQFQVNHLSHFLLTHLLRDYLTKSEPSRVVNVASHAHKSARKGLDFDDLEWSSRRYKGFAVYSCTKLMNILFTRELARRWRDTGVTANCVHPGFVASNFAKEGDLGWWGNIGMPLTRPFSISVEKGTRTSVYVASSPDVADISGEYFNKCRAEAPNAPARDDDAAARLWDVSAQITGVGASST